MFIITGFCLSVFRWLPFKLLPSTKEIFNEYSFFLILFFHRTLPFKGLHNSLFLHQPCQSTNVLIYTLISTKPLSAFLLCKLYSQTVFGLKEHLSLTWRQTLHSRLKIAIPHIPISSLAWYLWLIKYIDILVDAKSFRKVVVLSCP